MPMIQIEVGMSSKDQRGEFTRLVESLPWQMEADSVGNTAIP